MYGGHTAGRMVREGLCEETSPVGLRNKPPDRAVEDKLSVRSQPGCRGSLEKVEGQSEVSGN